MKKMLCVMALLTLSHTGALKVTLNGKPIPGSAVTQGGTVFISADALKAAGITVTVNGDTAALTQPSKAGGQNQLAALSGCVGETLFNGVWRFTVKDIQAGPVAAFNKPGWAVTIEIRNATSKPLSLTNSGFIIGNSGVRSAALAFADDSSIPSETMSYDVFKQVPPAGSYVFTATFPAKTHDVTETPSKLLFLRQGTRTYTALPWNTPDPGFRVNLNCRK